jgi:hypothetical protein
VRQDLNLYYEAELSGIKENKTNYAVSDSVINTAYPSSPVPVNTGHSTYQYWTTPSKNTPPTDIHRHYESELAKLNKYFHATVNTIGLTAYRRESGLVKTTSACTAVKKNILFNLMESDDSKTQSRYQKHSL